MTDKRNLLGTVAIAILVTSISFQTAAQDIRPGTLAGAMRRIIDSQGGPLAGGFTSGMGNLQFSQKAACELVGANCTEAQRMGCETIQTSLISGLKECWYRNSFQLYDAQTLTMVGNTKYLNMANLADNNTGYGLVLAKSNGSSHYSLLDERGQLLASGETLGCDTFESLGDDTVACVRGDKRLSIKVSDLLKARRASVRVDAISDDVSVNICNVAIETLQAGKGRLFNSNSDAFFSEMKEYAVGNEKIQIYKKTTPLGSSCVLEPGGESCTAIYVTNAGLECFQYGSLISKRPMKITREAKTELVKSLLFKGREVVTVDEILKISSAMPKLRIDRPDRFFSEELYVSATGSSSNKGIN